MKDQAALTSIPKTYQILPYVCCVSTNLEVVILRNNRKVTGYGTGHRAIASIAGVRAAMVERKQSRGTGRDMVESSTRPVQYSTARR